MRLSSHSSRQCSHRGAAAAARTMVPSGHCCCCCCHGTRVAAAAAAPVAVVGRARLTCQAAGRKGGGSGSSTSTTSSKPKRSSAPPPGSKGFGPPSKSPAASREAQEPWEAMLPQPYRVYYKQGYRPSRYWGPIQLEHRDGGVGVGVTEEVDGGQLLVLAHPVAFLQGTLGSAPAVEDLHIALLEAQLPHTMQHVLSFLPQRPVGAGPPVAAEPAAAAAAQGDEQQQPGQQQQQQATAAAPPPPRPAYGGRLPQELSWLVPSSWEQLGLKAADVKPLASRALMRMLQVSSWSEEFADPAASQVRHECPNGFIGVWPEWAVLAHSCAPNTSVCVVDRYLLLHANVDMASGTQLTTNKLGSAIAQPLAARQAAHWELFGRPCCCNRCTLEQQLSPEAAAELQAVADKAQGEWQDRLQALLESPSDGSMTQEEAADGLTELQDEITDAVLGLDAALEASLPDTEGRLLVTSGAYAAADLAWQMEELLMEEPDLDKLSACVALQRVFARGTDSHVYTAMLLNEGYTARAQALAKAAEGLQRRTAASQRRLTKQINEVLASADMAGFAYAEAVACRYGMIPPEGLLPRLEEGLAMFYAGLSAMSAAQGDGLDSVPEVTRNMTVDGIPVVVVDTVEGSGFAGAAGGGGAGGGDEDSDDDDDDDDGGSSGRGGSSSGGRGSSVSVAGRPGLRIELVDDGGAAAAAASPAELDDDDLAAAEAAIDAAIAAAIQEAEQRVA